MSIAATRSSSTPWSPFPVTHHPWPCLPEQEEKEKKKKKTEKGKKEKKKSLFYTISKSTEKWQEGNRKKSSKAQWEASTLVVAGTPAWCSLSPPRASTGLRIWISPWNMRIIAMDMDLLPVVLRELILRWMEGQVTEPPIGRFTIGRLIIH